MMQNNTLRQVLSVVVFPRIYWARVLKLPLKLCLCLCYRVYHRSCSLWIKIVILFHRLEVLILFRRITRTSFITLLIIVWHGVSPTPNKLWWYRHWPWYNALIGLLKQDKALFCRDFFLFLQLKLLFMQYLLIWKSYILSTLISKWWLKLMTW